MDDQPAVALPDIKVKDIVEAADDLTAAYRKLVGQVVDTAVRDRIVMSAVLALDSESIRGGLTQTVRQLEGRPLTEGAARRLAWQVAARTADLQRGPIVWFDVPTSNGWVALEGLAAEPAQWVDGSEAINLKLFCMTGTPAGFELTRKVPLRWLNYLAYQVGWNRRVEYPRDPQLFVGLRFWAFVVTRPGGELDMQSWATDPKLLRANRQIIRLRQRFDLGEAVCPLGFDHDCQDCTKRAHECPAAFAR